MCLQTHSGAQDDFAVWILLPLTAKCRDYRCIPQELALCGTGNKTQGLSSLSTESQLQPPLMFLLWMEAGTSHMLRKHCTPELYIQLHVTCFLIEKCQLIDLQGLLYL